MKQDATTVALFFLLGSVAALPCPDLGAQPSSPLDVAKSCPELSISYVLIHSCDSDGAGNGLFGCRMHSAKHGRPERTVFLPTNHAWLSYLQRTGNPLATLLAPSYRSQLTELLRGHVVVEMLTTDNRLLVKDDSQYIKFRTACTDERSLEVRRLSPGHQLSVAAGEGVGRVEGPTLQADILAGPAVVHIVDSVLALPAGETAAAAAAMTTGAIATAGGAPGALTAPAAATETPMPAANEIAVRGAAQAAAVAALATSAAAGRRRALSDDVSLSPPPPASPEPAAFSPGSCGDTTCEPGKTCLKGRCVGGAKLRFSIVWDTSVAVNIVVQSPDAAAGKEDGGVKDVSSNSDCSSGGGGGWRGGSWDNAGGVESFAFPATPSSGRYHVCAQVIPLFVRCRPYPGAFSADITLYITVPDNGNPAGRAVVLGPKTLGAGGDPGYCDPSNAGYLGSVDWCDGAQCAPTCVNPATNATKTCEPDQVCRPSDGACVRPCGGRICSPGQTCIRSPDLSNPSLEPGCVTEGQLRFTLATQHPAYFSEVAAMITGSLSFQAQTPKRQLVTSSSKTSGGSVFETAEGGSLAPKNIFYKSNAPTGRYHLCALFKKSDYWGGGGQLAEGEMGVITSVTSSLTVVGNAPSAASPSLTRVDPPVQLGKLEDELYLPEMTGGCYPGRAGYLASVDWCPNKTNTTCGETCGTAICPLGRSCRTKDNRCVEPCGTALCAVGRTCVRNSPYMPPTCVTDGQLRFTLLWNMPGKPVYGFEVYLPSFA